MVSRTPLRLLSALLAALLAAGPAGPGLGQPRRAADGAPRGRRAGRLGRARRRRPARRHPARPDGRLADAAVARGGPAHRAVRRVAPDGGGPVRARFRGRRHGALGARGRAARRSCACSCWATPSRPGQPGAPEAALTSVERLSQRVAPPAGGASASPTASDALGDFFDQFWKKDGVLKEETPADGADAAVPAPVTGRLPVSGLSYTIHRSKPGSEAVQYERLAANLKALGLPPYRTVREEAPVNPDRPTVAWLVNASVYKLAIAKRGGKSSPGDWHLAFDPSWFFQVDGDGKTVPVEFDAGGRPIAAGRNRIYLRKGLYFDKKGRPVLVEYRFPRPVGYSANFFTEAANSRTDGAPLERGSEIPFSASDELLSIFKEKMHTRMIAAEVGEGVPLSVGFLMPRNPVRMHLEEFADQLVARLVDMPESRERVREEIQAFLRHNRAREVVIKPSSSYFRSSRGVEFFDTTVPGVLEEMTDYVMALRNDPHMSSEGAVLVDQRIEPPAIYFRTEPYTGKRMAGELRGEMVDIVPLTKAEIAALPPDSPLKKDWNIRTFVSRTPDGGAKSMASFVRAGSWGGPTAAEPEGHPERAAAVIRLEDVVKMLRRQHGLLTTSAEANAFYDRVNRSGERIHMGIARREAKRTPVGDEPNQGRMDFIGIDTMVALEDGKLAPKLIEVNGHDSGGQKQFDKLNPRKAGQHSRELVELGLARARRDRLKGKRIVIVGDGYSSKRFILERARELGVEVVLVAKAGSWASKLAHVHIPVDTTKPGALERAIGSIRDYERHHGPVHGVTGYWEADIELTAGIAAALGKPFHKLDGVRSMRNKAAGGELLRRAGFNVVNQASVKEPVAGRPGDRARAEADLKKAMEHVGYPAVLKLDNGAAAVGMRIVSNWTEALAAYDRMLRLTAKENNNHHHGYDVTVWGLIEGKEFDYDVVRQGGRTAWGRLTDNWPIRKPLTIATGSSSPSRSMSAREQRKVRAELERILSLFGADDGVAHFEGKIDSQGRVFVFDPNARPGGHYVVPWVKQVWGRDLIEDMLMVAAGIPPGGYEAREPMSYLEGAFLRPDQTGVIKSLRLTPEGRRTPGSSVSTSSRAKASSSSAATTAPSGWACSRSAAARPRRRAATSRS